VSLFDSTQASHTCRCLGRRGTFAAEEADEVRPDGRLTHELVPAELADAQPGHRFAGCDLSTRQRLVRQGCGRAWERLPWDGFRVWPLTLRALRVLTIGRRVRFWPGLTLRCIAARRSVSGPSRQASRFVPRTVGLWCDPRRERSPAGPWPRTSTDLPGAGGPAQGHLDWRCCICRLQDLLRHVSSLRRGVPRDATAFGTFSRQEPSQFGGGWRTSWQSTCGLAATPRMERKA
jgi:hypothetical protein